jgi:hypothetical protein
MRSIIYAVTSLLAMTACLPAAADEVNEQQPLSDTPFFADMGAAVDIGALDTYRGGAEVVNGIRPEGIVASNTAYNVATGFNSISEGAFANANGLPIVIQNSGANVLIQNATIVNVRLQ